VTQESLPPSAAQLYRQGDEFLSELLGAGHGSHEWFCGHFRDW